MTYTECPICESPLDTSGVTDEIRYTSIGTPVHLECYTNQGE